MHSRLPCHTGEGCDAPCCHVIVGWDLGSFRKLEKQFPDLSVRYKVVRVLEKNLTNWYFVLPQLIVFLVLPGSMPEGEFRKYVEGLNWTLLKKFAGMRCIFLEKTGLCGIYELRPKICREYPFPDQPACPRANNVA
ncbi:MAG: YkgJ family cysteine cluster protein [Parcubacteria group bacterium]